MFLSFACLSRAPVDLADVRLSARTNIRYITVSYGISVVSVAEVHFYDKHSHSNTGSNAEQFSTANSNRES